jgi:hypothetical protein
MKLKNNIFTTLLLALGFIMHQITPGILGGMKFDFLLIFMFVSIILNPKFQNSILTGLLGGLLSAMTTTFPGGQIPNLLDKIITCLVLFVLIKSLQKFNMNSFIVGLLGGIGTIISGMVFLISAYLIVGLPASIGVLVIGIVVPTTIVNIAGTVFVYKIVKIAMKSSGMVIN